MHHQFVRVVGSKFMQAGKEITLRGFGLGNWLNLEHFMFGWPGTDTQIRSVIIDHYGEENARVFWKTFYENSISESDIAYIAQLGLNSIRIPVNHRLFLPEITKSDGIREINRILEYCRKYKIWALLDMHTAPGCQNPDWHSDNSTGKYLFWQNNNYQQELISLWQQIADYYKDETMILGYDLVNEPCYLETELDKSLISFSRNCTAAIREIDKNHVIFYEGNVYSRDFSMFRENFDENCAYTFHYYPFLQIPGKLDEPDVEKILHDNLHKEVTLNHLTKNLKKPLWCGETGHLVHLPESFNVLSIFLDLLESENISWAIWPFKDIGAMGLLNLKASGKWNRIAKKASNHWSFWNIFKQDSMLSAQQESDKSVFYRKLSEHTTNSFNLLNQNLLRYSFGELLESIDDFKFERCNINSRLLSTIKF